MRLVVYVEIAALALLFTALGAAPLICKGLPAEPSEIAAAGMSGRYSLEAVAETGAGESIPSVDEVLDRYVKALGGREAMEKLTTRVCTGRYVKDLHWDDPPYEEYPIEVFAKLPDKILIVEHKPDGVRREGYDGGAAWVQDKGGVEIVDEFGSMKVAWVCNPQNALLIKDYFSGLKAVPDKTYHGTWHCLEPSELKKHHYSLYFDKEAGILVQIGCFWELQKYRAVDGVKFPYRVLMSRKGGWCAFEFEEVKHNISLDDSMFAPPEGPDE
jgi:hypothetical protein